MGRGRVPNYWWDFSSPGEMPIKVESDVDYLPYPIAVFNDRNAIKEAENLIKDLREGRADPRRAQ